MSNKKKAVPLQDSPWLTAANLRAALALYITETEPVGARLSLQRLDRAGTLTTVSINLPLVDWDPLDYLDFPDAAYYKVDPDSGIIAAVTSGYDLIGCFCEAVVFGSLEDLKQHAEFRMLTSSPDEFLRAMKRWAIRRPMRDYLKADRPKERNRALARMYEILDA